MEPSPGGKKIFRARKTMNPSSRQQMESLNKLRDALEKERVSKETNKESRTVPLAKQDDASENDHFGQEIFKVESKSTLSEEKDMSPNKLTVPVEVLGIDSAVAACSPEKDSCNVNFQTAKSVSPSEVKPYTTENPPLSTTPIENTLIRNILNDIYDQEACVAFSEHTMGDVTSSLQDNLSRKLHDMLVEEKKIIATTAPTPLETDSESEDLKMTDKVLLTPEKIVIPLNLSEGDEDDGLLSVSERMNEKVDTNIANQADGAIILQDINPISQSGGVRIPCSMQLLVKDTLDSNLKSEIMTIPGNQKVTCLDESKTFPQKDTMDVDLKNEACGDINSISQSGGVSIPCSMQLLVKDTLDSSLKSEIINIPGNQKVSCLDESKSFPQKDTMDVDLKNEACGDINFISQSGGVRIPCSMQLLVKDTLDSSLKSEIMNIPGNQKVTCLDESETFPQKDTMDVDLKKELMSPQASISQSGGVGIPCSMQLPVKDTLDTNLKSEIINIPDNQKVTCLDESKKFPQKDTMDVDLKNEACGDINPISQSGGVGIPCSTQLPVKDTLDSNVKSEIINIPGNQKVTCLDESKTFPQKDTMDVDLKNEACGDINPISQSGGVSIPCSTQLPVKDTLDSNVKSEIFNIPGNQKVTCLDESQSFPQKDTMDVDLKNEVCGESDSKTSSDIGGKISLSQKHTLAIDLKIKDSASYANKSLSCVEGEAISKKETVVENLNNAALCTNLNEVISCQGPDVSSQNIIPPIESDIARFPRKRLNSEKESTTCKRFKSIDDISSKSEEINGISEKVKILIDRQLQIFFSDVFDERLEQLTERVKQIQCGKKHEDLAAKCLRKLRRFEKNANIAVKSLKEVLQQHKMQSSTTEPKGTVPHDHILTVQQTLLIDKPVTGNPVVTSTTTKPSLPLYLQSTCSAQFASSVPDNATTNPACLAYAHGSGALKSSTITSASRNEKVPGHVNLQNVSSSTSPASCNFFQAERGTGTVVLDERHDESESFIEKVRLKSLTSSIPDILSRQASTDRGAVLNLRSNYEVSIEEIKKTSGMVIDLTEEECSSKRAVSIKDQDSSLKIKNLQGKQIEATGAKSVWSLKNVNDHKISALTGKQKLVQMKKSPQRSNLEHSISSETSRVLLGIKSNESAKELGLKSFGVSENAAKQNNEKSSYGETEQSNLECKGVQKNNIVPSATNLKTVEKTLQKLKVEKCTSNESSVKPINIVLNDARRAQYMSHVGSMSENKATSFPSCLTSQDKETTTKKTNQAIEKCFQPSTLTQPELRDGVKDSLPPQKIDLKLTQVQNPRGIALSWNCAEVDPRCCPAQSYCLYVQQEDLKCSRSEWKWKKIGEIKALPLPMACTLSHFVGGSRYYFTLRAKDIYERFGPFSDVQTTLLPLQQSHDITVAKTPDRT